VHLATSIARLNCPCLMLVLQILFGKISALPPRREVRCPINCFSGSGRWCVDTKLPVIDVNRGNFLQNRRITRPAQDTLANKVPHDRSTRRSPAASSGTDLPEAAHLHREGG
jgi:hypothetical protein